MRIEKHPILKFEPGAPVTFTFDGRRLQARSGDTVAAALLANGVEVFRESARLHRPRGFFCGIGRCSSCNMIVDGVPDVRVCVTPVAEGMDVRTQRGHGRIDGLPA
jgi:aerobic-type carbon monoxide dehydrogenase small subunit (CoxS/CutS family)